MGKILELLKKVNRKFINTRTFVVGIGILLLSIAVLAALFTYNLELVTSNGVTDWGAFLSLYWEQFFNLLLYLVAQGATSLTFEGWLSIGIVEVVVETVISVLGILVTGFTVAGITSYLVEKVLRRLMGMNLPKLKGHTVVCGWNDSAKLIVKKIHDEDPDEPIVLINDRGESPITGQNLYWIKGDFTNQDDLKKAFAHEAATAIILADTESAGNNKPYADSRTVLSVLSIESMNSDVHTAAELINPENRSHLERANVDEIVISGELSGTILSRVSENKGLSKIVRSLLEVGDGSEIYRVDTPDTMKSKTFSELYTSLYDTNTYMLLGFEDTDGNFYLSPPKNTKMSKAAALYIVAETTPKLV